MPAYVIVEIVVHDPELYKTYTALTPKTIEDFGGKFLVRGGDTVSLEGESLENRNVVLEFPSVEIAEAWWNSDAYCDAKKIRQKAATTKMNIVEGI